MELTNRMPAAIPAASRQELFFVGAVLAWGLASSLASLLNLAIFLPTATAVDWTIMA